MFRFVCIISLNLFFGSTTLSAYQISKIDSLKQSYDMAIGLAKVNTGLLLADELIVEKPEVAELLISDLIDQAETHQSSKLLIEAYIKKAELLTKNQEYLNATDWLNKAITLANNTDDQSDMAEAYLNLGHNFARLYHDDKAIEALSKSAEIGAKTQQHSKRISALSYLGSIHQNQNKIESALSYYKEALAIAEWHGFRVEDGITLLSIGKLELERNNHKVAQEYLEKCLHVSEKYNSQSLIALSHLYLAENYRKLNEPSTALLHYDKALEIRAQQHSTDGYTDVLIRKARILMELEQYEASNYLIKEAHVMLKSSKNQYLPGILYQLKVSHAESQGDYKTAFNALKSWSKINDSLTNHAANEEVSKLQADFHIEKQALNQEFEAEQSRIKKSLINQRVPITIGFSVLLVIVLILYIYNRQKLRTQIALRDKDKMLLQKDIALKERELTLQKKRLHDLETYTDTNGSLSDVIKSLRSKSLNPEIWSELRMQFERAFPNFFDGLLNTNRDLTVNDQRLAALLKLGLSTKEIARIISISPAGVAKARLRLSQRLNLESAKGLEAFLAER